MPVNVPTDIAHHQFPELTEHTVTVSHQVTFASPLSHLAFELHAPRSSFKSLLTRTSLQLSYRRMSASSALPTGLKNKEAEKGTLGHKSPVRYVPEKSLLVDDEISEKQTSYKLKLPDRIGSGEHIIWKGGTSEKFLVHAVSAKAIVTKMGIWKEYDDTISALSNAHEKLMKCYRKVDPMWDPTSDEDGYLVDAFVNIPKKPTLSDGEDDTEDAAVKVKHAYNKAREALNLANEEPANAAKKAFELYNNLLGEDEQSAWQQN